jgi:hypothetical protein
MREPTSVDWDEGRDAAPVVLHWTRRDPATGELVIKLVAAEANAGLMVRHLTYIYDRLRDGAVHRTVFETDLRYSTRAEIEMLLQEAGLHVTHVYGDYDLSPAGSGENLIFMARAEKGP